MICPCGKEITRNQYCAENERQWAKREASGFCRPKCKRLHTPPKPDRPAPPLSLLSCRYERSEGEAQPKEVPVRDQGRLAFARSMPCVLCGSIQGVHAHHESPPGHGTLSGKTSDRNTLPLCFVCHRLRHDKGREIYGGIDVEGLIQRINEAYDRRSPHKRGEGGREDGNCYSRQVREAGRD